MHGMHAWGGVPTQTLMLAVAQCGCGGVKHLVQEVTAWHACVRLWQPEHCGSAAVCICSKHLAPYVPAVSLLLALIAEMCLTMWRLWRLQPHQGDCLGVWGLTLWLQADEDRLQGGVCLAGLARPVALGLCLLSLRLRPPTPTPFPPLPASPTPVLRQWWVGCQGVGVVMSVLVA